MSSPKPSLPWECCLGCRAGPRSWIRRTPGVDGTHHCPEVSGSLCTPRPDPAAVIRDLSERPGQTPRPGQSSTRRERQRRAQAQASPTPRGSDTQRRGSRHELSAITLPRTAPWRLLGKSGQSHIKSSPDATLPLREGTFTVCCLP